MNIPDREVDRHNWETMTPLAAAIVATWVVDRAEEVRRVLEARLNWQPHRQLSLRTLLIGLQMLGMVGRHGHHRQVRLALRSLPFAAQRALNVVDGRGTVVSYRQVEKAMTQIARILESPTVLVDHDHDEADPETGEVFPCPVTCPFMEADHDWFAAEFAYASMPEDIPRALDMSMDWTDVQTWGKQIFRFEPDAVTDPKDVGDDAHSAALTAAAPKSKRPKGPLGPDGRPVPSKDQDGRWGHRSARPGVDPFFIGADNHTLLGVPGRDGTQFAAFLYGSVLVPAGSYAGDAAMKLLRIARYHGVKIRDLIADRGYTRLNPDRFWRPAHLLVEDIVMDLTQNQQKQKVDYTVVMDEGQPEERVVRIARIAGSFFTDGLPTELIGLERPAINANREERERIQKLFDLRKKFAFVRHDHPSPDTQRWAGPASRYAGFKVRCPNNHQSMRAAHKRPLTSCVEGVQCSCSEVVVIDDPDTDRERQRRIWGTTQWTKSYNRRTVVERGYSDDKYQVTNFTRASVYCFGTVKHSIYYSPIIVARNIQVALRWYRDHDMVEPWGLDEICRPDYKLPPELGGVHAVDDALDPSPEGEPAEGEAAPAEPAEEADEDEAEDDDTDGPTKPGRNRKQRRAAKPRSRSSRPPDKPTKPPPRRTPKPDEQ